MEITTKAETTYKIVVTETELIHLEAAVDAFTDMTVDKAMPFLGMYDKRFNADIANGMLAVLQGVREDIADA